MFDDGADVVPAFTVGLLSAASCGYGAAWKLVSVQSGRAASEERSSSSREVATRRRVPPVGSELLRSRPSWRKSFRPCACSAAGLWNPTWAIRSAP